MVPEPPTKSRHSCIFQALSTWHFPTGEALSGRFRAFCLERSDLTSGLLRPAMFWSSQKPSQQPCARIKSLVWLGNACIGLLSSDAYMFAQPKSEGWRTRQASPSLCLSLSPHLGIRPSLCLPCKTVDNSTSLVASSPNLRASFLAKAGCIHALDGCNS